MADRICMDTQLLEQLSSQITAISNALSSVQTSVNSASAEVRRVAASQNGIIQKMNSLQKNTRLTVAHAQSLSAAVRRASILWSDTERELAGTRMQPSEAAPGNPGGGGAAAGGNRLAEDAIITSLKYPKDKSRWTKDMWDAYNKAVSEAEVYSTTDGRVAVVSGDKIIIAGGSGVVIFSDSVSVSSHETSVTVYGKDGSYTKVDGSLGFETAGWDGKLLAKDKDGKYKPVEIKRHELFKYEDGDVEAKRIGKIFEVGISGSVEHSALHGETSYKNGIVSGEASYDVSKAEAHASLKGGLYATSVDANGNVTYHLEPGIAAEIGASYTLFETNASGQIGGDNLNVHGSTGVTMGQVSAQADASLGIVDGKFTAHAGAKAEAIAIEAEGKVGVNVAGIEGNVTGKVNIGIGAHADVGYHDGKIKCDIGASVGVGASVSVELDVSGFVDNVGKAVDGAKKTVGALQKAGKSLLNRLF